MAKDAEMQAMSKVYGMLMALPADARARVWKWVSERLAAEGAQPTGGEGNA